MLVYAEKQALAFTVFLMGALVAAAGPLKDYVDLPDPSYRFRLAETIPGQGYTLYVLDMTSQTWREGDVAPSKWEHWVPIIEPDVVQHDTALLLVTGGNNSHDKVPTGVLPPLLMIALQTKSVVAAVQGVPCEPVAFRDESRTRTEDEIIAYTYNKFLETGDPTWPLLCPMVKSAVRAMDSIQEFLGKQADKKVPISHFVVTGASKRGWTTWLTGAIDDRVVAIAPIVIDMLNLGKQMARQMEYYGQYSEAIQDYTDFKIQDRVNSSGGRDLTQIVDPYEYRDVLTKPKLVLLASGDQYWTVDAANLYFPELKGEKHIRYQANADHSIDSSEDTIKALAAFYYNILSDHPTPEFRWDLKPDGRFEVKPDQPPLEARLWKAESPTMDFRLRTIGPVWTSAPLAPGPGGVITGKVEAPPEGHVAYFVELVYSSPLGFNYSLTTLTSVPGQGGTLRTVLILAAPLVLIVVAGVFLFRYLRR